jgi:hypothetical protein
MKNVIIAFLAVFLLVTDSHAQGNKTLTQPDSFLEKFIQDEQQRSAGQDISMFPISHQDSFAEDYRRFVYQHRKMAFTWQLTSSKIIFWMVMGLVVTGVFFSWLQFRLALKSVPYRKEVDTPGEQSADNKPTSYDPNSTQLEASLQGVKVSSSVLGVILLVISLMFFYLYLTHVYRLEEISEPKSTTLAPQPANP